MGSFDPPCDHVLQWGEEVANRINVGWRQRKSRGYEFPFAQGIGHAGFEVILQILGDSISDIISIGETVCLL